MAKKKHWVKITPKFRVGKNTDLLCVLTVDGKMDYIQVHPVRRRLDPEDLKPFVYALRVNLRRDEIRDLRFEERIVPNSSDRNVFEVKPEEVGGSRPNTFLRAHLDKNWENGWPPVLCFGTKD